MHDAEESKIMGKTVCSIIVPIWDEEENLREMYKRICDVFDSFEQKHGYEIIFIDDGSQDGSLELLKELSRADANIRIISFSRNFGHQFAITAGIDHASGDAVITIDGDLQDPPEVIPEMLAKWRQGYRVVYGVRARRHGESLFKRLTAKIFYRLIRQMSEMDLPVDAGDFRLMDRVVVDALKSLREENRYIRGLVKWLGFSQFGLTYNRDRRYAGKTKFSLKKMIRFAADGVLSFSDKPLKISAFLGSIITIFSFMAGLWVAINKIRSPHMVISGWASMILAVLFMGGVQLLSLGVLGIYLGRQYREVKRRPLYIVSEKIGFGDTVKMPQERSV